MTRQIIPTAEVFDVQRFVADLDAFRQRQGLTLAAIGRAAGVDYTRLANVRSGYNAPFDVIVRLAVVIDVSLDSYIRDELMSDVTRRLEIELNEKTRVQRRGERGPTTPRRPLPDVSALSRDLYERACELGYHEVLASKRSAWRVDGYRDGYTTEAARIARQVAKHVTVSKETIFAVLLGSTTPLPATVVSLATWLGNDPETYLPGSTTTTSI